jgi:hypothetical protein
MPQGIDGDLRTGLLREFEAWYGSFETVRSFVQVDLDKAHDEDGEMCYKSSGFNVSEW